MRADWHPYRLRARRLRRLHDHRRRRSGALLPDVRGAGRRQDDPHRRGVGRWRQIAPATAGLHRSPRTAMRLLHARIFDAGGERVGAATGHRRRCAARHPVGQSVPLHRLPEHHPGGARRRRADAWRQGDRMNDVGHAAHEAYPTPPQASERRVLGHGVTRLEDLPLVTGSGRYAGDINFPRQLHMRIVRAPVAHGKLVGIDTAAALAMPGIVAVWTSADLGDLSPVDFRADKSAEALKPYRQPVLALGRVRYVGDPVTAVFAEDPYVAEDAAETVRVEVEDLPVIVSADDPPGEFDIGRGTEAAVLRHSFGDIEGAFR